MSAATEVAVAIAEVAAAADPPLRRPAGKAATALLGARAAMDDAAFEGVLRQAMLPTW